MPSTTVPQAQGEQEQQQQQEAPSFFRTALQSIGIFLAVQFLIKTVLSGSQNGLFGTSSSTSTDAATAASPSSIPAYSARPAPHEITGNYSSIPKYIAPMWDSDVSMDVMVYVSPSLVMPGLKNMRPGSLVLSEKDVRLDGWSDKRDIHTRFPIPKEVQHNSTLWAHIFVAQSGAPIDPTEPAYDTSRAYHFARPLTQHLLKKKAVKTRKLLSDDPQSQREDRDANAVDDSVNPNTGKKKVVSYYHPNITLSFIPNAGTNNYPTMHPAAREWIQLDPAGARDVSGQNGWYYPVLYANTFWQLRDHMTEVNDTVTTLPLNIHLNRLSHWKFSVISSFDYGIKVNAAKLAAGENIPGGGDGSEMEEVKRIILDSNVYLLSTTVVVGLLHTLFEMLAFKSDVTHWRTKKDNVGVSVRTILANVLMQSIIFLYLLDNSEGTSWMIMFGQGLGIVLEAWKITKTVDVHIIPTPADSTAGFPWKHLPYMIVVKDKHVPSETERQTQEYDAIAFYYLYRLAIPLLGAYAIYSLLYDTHKSWYSFIITTLVGSVYAYGFLMMVPSLYINYRLQSVAHMPGRAMTYKFLNTFIDDLFAFTVKMPLLHRLATLRDDVIFFVYLYQGWKYKVDYSRVNEFGQGGEDGEDDAGAAAKSGAKKLLEADGDVKMGDGVEVASAATTGSAARAETGRKRK